jgi:hypothetical protein
MTVAAARPAKFAGRNFAKLFAQEVAQPLV